MRHAALLFVIALAGCRSTAPVAPQVSAVLDETFALRVGQQVNVGTEPLRLFFDAVTEDSRCPTDVVCVWEGNAKVRLRASTPGSGAITIDLNTSLQPRDTVVFAYDVALERLDPQPVAATKTPQDRYVAYLKVSRP